MRVRSLIEEIHLVFLLLDIGLYIRFQISTHFVTSTILRSSISAIFIVPNRTRKALASILDSEYLTTLIESRLCTFVQSMPSAFIIRIH